MHFGLRRKSNVSWSAGMPALLDQHLIDDPTGANSRQAGLGSLVRKGELRVIEPH